MGEAVRRLYIVLATIQVVAALDPQQLFIPPKFGEKGATSSEDLEKNNSLSRLSKYQKH